MRSLNKYGSINYKRLGPFQIGQEHEIKYHDIKYLQSVLSYLSHKETLSLSIRLKIDLAKYVTKKDAYILSCVLMKLNKSDSNVKITNLIINYKSMKQINTFKW
jgi:hypothetical protein